MSKKAKIIVGLVLVAVAAGVGYYFYNKGKGSKTALVDSISTNK